VYEITFHKKAAANIHSLPKAQKDRVKHVLEQLQINPFSYPYRKIRGETNIYRIRFGGYRLLFEVVDEHGKIIVLKFEKRSTVYG